MMVLFWVGDFIFFFKILGLYEVKKLYCRKLIIFKLFVFEMFMILVVIFICLI